LQKPATGASALDGEGKAEFPSALPTGPVALVLGAEGEGLRHNVLQHCDSVARLPISRAIESLNVSNAAAIALRRGHAPDRRRRRG
jgi:23S rRNA (guanosine2251-2'-O)-methyltransferase